MKKIFLACIITILMGILATAALAQYNGDIYGGGHMGHHGDTGYYGNPGVQGYTGAPGYAPAPTYQYLYPYPQGGYVPQPYYPYPQGGYNNHHHGGYGGGC